MCAGIPWGDGVGPYKAAAPRDGTICRNSAVTVLSRIR